MRKMDDFIHELRTDADQCERYSFPATANDLRIAAGMLEWLTSDGAPWEKDALIDGLNDRAAKAMETTR